MRTIYVVEGSTGEYSDRNEWPVAAFTDEALAMEMVKRCEKFAPKDDLSYQARRAAKNPYDPNMKVDYTGTSYSYYEVTVLDAIPAVES